MAVASAASVDAFVSQKTLAVVGVSRSGKKFGNVILKELMNKGYTVYPVHPEAESVNEVTCYRSLQDLPAEVGGVVLVVKPDQTMQVVKDAHAAGISRVWFQQGSENGEALAFCEQNGIDAVSRECLLMFAEPVESIHKLHRGLKGLFGRLPK